MGWLDTFINGQRPDMRLPGYAEGQLGKLQDYFNSIGSTASNRAWKKDIKDFDRDPLSLASVSTARNAVNEREAAERGGQGTNALIMNSGAGGEQANLLQHNMETQRDKRQEQYGLDAMSEAYGRRNMALQGHQQAHNDRVGQEMGTLGMMSNLFSNAFNANRKGGAFNPADLGTMLAKYGMSAIPGG